MRRLWLALLAVAYLGLASCDLSETASYENKVVRNGDPARGRALIASGVHGCTTCHTVPGIGGVQGVVGPPLDGLGRRGFIAGQLPNMPSVLCAFGLNNVKLLLNSGIGQPYNPATGQGTVGRNYTNQTMASVNVFYPESVRINPFMGAGALGTVIDDYNGDNFDHAGLGFVGGGYIAANSTGARPIEYHPVPPGTSRWGLAWKQAVRRHYNHTVNVGVRRTHGQLRHGSRRRDRQTHGRGGRGAVVPLHPVLDRPLPDNP